MPTGIYKRTPEMKSGKHKRTKELRNRISKTLKKKGIKPPSRKGAKLSEETKKKIGLKHKGKIISKETRKKLSKALKGRKITWGDKISKAQQGEKGPNWRGGISNNPYSVDWRETLRRSIRERDNYICQLCSKQQGDKALSVHHIDYNKKNSNPENLITLCKRCHNKTNYNRKYWSEYFQNINNKRKI